MSETFSHFLMNVSYAYVNAHEWRYGQTCYNVLYELDPDLATSLTGTDKDPYYDDNRVPEFLKRLRDEWEDI